MLSLKDKIISKVQTSSDDQVLQEVYRILDLDNYSYSKEQIAQLKEADETINYGKFSMQEEMENKMQQWLNNTNYFLQHYHKLLPSINEV